MIATVVCAAAASRDLRSPMINRDRFRNASRFATSLTTSRDEASLTMQVRTLRKCTARIVYKVGIHERRKRRTHRCAPILSLTERTIYDPTLCNLTDFDASHEFLHAVEERFS